MISNEILYHEKHTGPKWIWIIIITLFLLFWGIAFVQLVFGQEIGNNPMSDNVVLLNAFIFGLFFPIMLLLMRGEVTVSREAVIIKFTPFYKKTIEVKNISKMEQAEIHVIQNFGGWGIRWNGMKWGFILDGKNGIELFTNNGNIYVISSKNTTMLYQSIEENLNTNKS